MKISNILSLLALSFTLTFNVCANASKIHAFYYDIKPLQQLVSMKVCHSLFSRLNTTMTEASILKNYNITGTYHFSAFNTLSLATSKQALLFTIQGKQHKAFIYNSMVDVVGNGENHGYGIVAIGKYCSGKYYMAG